ncbi:MAG: caspase family protein [Geobacteraceae bacterium]|nr:caspase family protein [Geobacteraceae bacterium]
MIILCKCFHSKYLLQAPLSAFAYAIFFLLVSTASANDRSITIKSTADESRLALVIGNSNYANSPLKNPVNDARDISMALKKLGFQVIYEEDASRRSMDEAIRAFYQKLRNGGVGLFYYAGHGMQVNGRNYLIPIGARIESESDIEHESIDIARVLGKMEDAGNPVNIVILDACRDNPFARSFRSSRGGLARMDAPTGTIVAYATAPESVAADGKDKNGVYTKHLLKALTIPGLTIEQVFKHVRNDVITETGNRQIPWESTSLRGDFYFTTVKKMDRCSIECLADSRTLEELLSSSKKDLVSYDTLKKKGRSGGSEAALVLKKIVCDFKGIEALLQEQYLLNQDESLRQMQSNTAKTRQKYEESFCELNR